MNHIRTLATTALTLAATTLTATPSTATRHFLTPSEPFTRHFVTRSEPFTRHFVTPSGRAMQAGGDASGDVMSFPIDDSAPGVAEPTRTNGDVTTMRARHGRYAVVITLTTRDFDPTTPLSGGIFAFKTNKGFHAEAFVFSSHGAAPEVTLTVSDRPLRCHGLRGRLDFEANTVRVRVPRSCLNNPRWVRVGAGASTMDDTRYYADDAQSPTVASESITFGPRLRRA